MAAGVAAGAKIGRFFNNEKTEERKSVKKERKKVSQKERKVMIPSQGGQSNNERLRS
jgi:hypothetical protein